MKLVQFVLTVLLTLFLAPGVSAQSAETFTQQQREQKIADIEIEIAESKRIALVNQTWDTACKIALLFLAIAAAAGTGYVVAQGQAVTPPIGLKMFNAITAALTAALTTFAFSQFDFAKRETVWRERSIQLAGCRDVLRYTNPSPQEFLAQLTDVLRLGDSSSVNQLTASCARGRNAPAPDTQAGKARPPEPAASK